MKKNKGFCICPLASGSKGNSVFVSSPETSVLIDAGLSGIEIQRRLTQVGQTPEQLSAIIITHEHSDHVRGAGILSRRFNIPVYITPQTFNACNNLGKVELLNFFECGTAFSIDQLQVVPFSISHDAQDPAGLTLSFGESKIGIATDLGHATGLVKEHLKNCHLLYIESNHDPEMLINGSYPWFLKQRVKSRTGHLSNMDTRQLLTEILDQDLNSDLNPTLQHVILAHLSEENNCPKKAAIEVAKGLNGSDIALYVAGPDQPGEMIRL
ncbi:MAG: MBL fold metallo-hydrolase [Desulfobacteraceae bacterium]|nr:MBL fold metallo-hydrolase [Desulfobacteraceae bacterium]